MLPHVPRLSVAAIALALAAALGAPARAPLFFNPGATGFEPEIGVVNSGVLSDVQATVSPDRKYVTLNIGGTDAKALALREFSFRRDGNLGFVGSGRKPAARSVGNPDPKVEPPAAAESVPAKPSVLDQPGMTRISSLTQVERTEP